MLESNQNRSQMKIVHHTCQMMLALITVGAIVIAPANVLAAEGDSDTRPTADQLPQGAWDKPTLSVWGEEVGQSAVNIDGTAEIKWQPEPFVFEAGKTVRYIDYAEGDDANEGTKAKPWKHHPWDSAARDKAAAFEGVATYVFKRGVIYRGALVGDESGTAEEPIRLTSDPTWGSGEATIAGSAAITGGWKKLSDEQATAAGFPEPSHSKLWYVDLEGDYEPQALWVLKPDGERERLLLARWPNWKIEHPYNHFTQWFRADRVDKGFPRTSIYAPKILNDPDRNAYKGATIWMDHANTSGEFSIIGPYPSSVGHYDPATGRLQPALTHPRRHPAANGPFYLENMTKFLDEAGEWYYSRAGDDEHRLYLRLPGDGDPNTLTVEPAQHKVILDIQGAQHVEVSGLTLTGGNAIPLRNAPRAGDYDIPGNHVLMAAIRLNNGSNNIILKNLAIVDTAGTGIVNHISEENTVLRHIQISDSRFEAIDNGGIKLVHKSSPIRFPNGRLTDISILRNQLINIGLRCSTDQGGRGIDVDGLEVGEIAGNMAEYIAGQGINVVGGRFGTDMPLIRIRIHHNLVRDTLLHKTDFGGIEFWGIGPAYVYNNISINPVGFVAHRDTYHKNQAYYFDHGAKGYLFNNIGWSGSHPDVREDTRGQYFFHEIRNRWNQAFHNTALNFRAANSHASRHGSQQHYLANLFINCNSGSSHWTLAEAAEIGFARNIYAGEFDNVYNRWKGDTFYSPEQYRQSVASLTNHIAKQYGWATNDMPIRDAKTHDFRLTDTSAAIDRGVKVFVPWALAGTVGEWHFRLHPRDPNTVLPYDAYIQPFHGQHSSFRMGASDIPENQLVGNGFTAEQYVTGPLEDWTPGAVVFDGQKQFTLAHKQLVQDFTIKRNKEDVTVPGADRKTVRMTDNNFLIEAVLRIEKGQAGGTIAGKLGDDAGYALQVDDAGQLAVHLRAGSDIATQTSHTAINDGQWHHVLVEVDRKQSVVKIYIDGENATSSLTGSLPAADATLDNVADFVVGHGFVGAIDYLRVCRGTLADSQTTIEELMAWQFNGPALHDFVGRAPTGGVRDVGAIEHPTVTGRQTINSAAPKAIAKVAPADGDELKTGPDRTVKTLDWGAVSVPKQIAAGQVLDVQVAFATETIGKPHILRIDLHAFVGPKRIPGHGRAHPIKVTPGSTKPYTAELTVRPREGLTRIAAVIYASPDGSYQNNTVSTEVGIPIVEAAEGAVKTGGSQNDGPPKADVQVKEFDWGSITVPKNTAVGQKMPVTVKFKDDAVNQSSSLRIDLHWWKGRDRAGVLAAARHPNPKSGESVTKEFTIPDKEGLAAIAAVVYVSPDGSYDKRYISGTAGGIGVLPADQPTKAPGASGKEKPAKPVPVAGKEVETKKTDWGTLTITKNPSVGQTAEVTVTLAEGLVTETTMLKVDLHWWKGRNRAGALGRFGQKKIQPGETGPFVFRKAVPDKDGIAAIAGVVSLSPDGVWNNRTHSSEIGTRVSRNPATDKP